MEKYIVLVYSGSEWENSFSPCKVKTAFYLASLDKIPSKLALVIDQDILKKSEEEEDEDPRDFFFTVLLMQDGKGKPIKHPDLTIGEYRFFLFD